MAYRYIRGLGQTTRFNIELIIAFVIRNSICFSIKVKNLASFIKHSSIIYTINLILLAFRVYINIVIN